MIKHMWEIEVLDAESWGFFLGLKLASECNISNLMVESDSGEFFVEQ